MDKNTGGSQRWGAVSHLDSEPRSTCRLASSSSMLVLTAALVADADAADPPAPVWLPPAVCEADAPPAVEDAHEEEPEPWVMLNVDCDCAICETQRRREGIGGVSLVGRKEG